MSSAYEASKAFLETLFRTERLRPSELQAYQSGILAHLVRHALNEVPFYRGRGLPTGIINSSAEDWLRTPTICRSSLAVHGEEFCARRIPENHGKVLGSSSGGSTGVPVKSTSSYLASMGRAVAGYRMFTAFNLVPALGLLVIRHKSYAADGITSKVFRKWAYQWLPEVELGDRMFLDIETAATDQLNHVDEHAPVYVNTFPSNILRLVVEQRRRGGALSIPAIMSVAEYLPPEVVAGAEKAFGSRVINILSSSEAGVIAIQCPESDMLHIQSELVLAEILNEEGRPCAEGEVGELVVTPLYNYAMPLIRYRSGDFVVKGGPCPCGRSLPTIARFFGRKEHLFHFPDGSRALPPIDRVRICELIGHDAWQLVQVSRELAELRYESSPAMPEMAEAVRASVMEALAGLSVELKEVSAVPKTSGGKRHFTVNAKW